MRHQHKSIRISVIGIYLFIFVYLGCSLQTINTYGQTQKSLRNPKDTLRRIEIAGRYDSGRILMNNFFGVNVGQCKASIMDVKKVASWIRDYSEWEWLEPKKGLYRFTSAMGSINYDAYYKKLKKQGIKSLFVVQQSPRWISACGQDKDYRACAPSENTNGLSPQDYKDAASFFYQLAARYGQNKIPSKFLGTEDKLSGLNLMNVIEVYNEPDGHWGNRMTLKQYAALLNAVYDGDMGQLKGPYGIKAADPSMPVSIGGLAGNLNSLKKIVKFAGRAPFDIINVHFYTFRYVREHFRVSVPPEWSSLESDMKSIVKWGRKYAPGRPVWLTEMGWDTKNYSTEFVTEQEAANYLIRSYLLALGVGVRKCFWFIFTDLDTVPHPGVFSSSGLFENRSVPYGGSTQLKPKLTYWYDGTFKHLTAGYFFDSNQSFPDGDSTIYQYNFIDTNGEKRLSIMWYCPKFQYAFRPLIYRKSNVKFVYKLPGSTWKISKVVRPAAGTMDGIGQPYNYSHKGNAINLTLNATPVFIELVKKE